MTFNEHGNAMLARAKYLRESATGDAARDLSLSITHLEDALTRFNSALYRIQGMWVRRDPEVA